MSLGTVSRTVASIVRKRGLAVAAALACAQLWSPGGAKANPANPSSLYSSCYSSTIGSTLYPYCYAQWDASPYSSGDVMYFYFGLNSTTVNGTNAWQVQYSNGGNRDPDATNTSDSFFPYKNASYPGPVYSDPGHYLMGFQAHNSTTGDSATEWCGVVQNP